MKNKFTLYLNENKVVIYFIIDLESWSFPMWHANADASNPWGTPGPTNTLCT